MGLIYCIKNKQDGRCYIGQTIQPLEKRLKHHLWMASSGSKYHIHNAIRKYGWDNFTVVAWYVGDEVLDVFETEKIKEFDGFHNGYNMTSGGETPGQLMGVNNPKARRIVIITPEERIEEYGCIRDVCRKYKELTPSGLNDVLRGRQTHTKKFRACYTEDLEKLEEIKKYDIKKYMEINKNKHREKIRQSHLGTKNYKMRGQKHPNSKAIILIHPDGFEEKFGCIRTAEKKYDLPSSSLYDVAKGKRKQTKGFKCKYV